MPYAQKQSLDPMSLQGARPLGVSQSPLGQPMPTTVRGFKPNIPEQQKQETPTDAGKVITKDQFKKMILKAESDGMDGKTFFKKLTDSGYTVKEEEKKGFFPEIGRALAQRGQQLKENIVGFEQKRQEALGAEFGFKGIEGLKGAVKTAAALPREALQTLGTTAGAALDVAWEGVENLTQAVVPNSRESAIGEKGMQVLQRYAQQPIGKDAIKALQQGEESWNSFSQRYPETAQTIEATVNIADILGFTAVGKKVGKEALEQGIKQGTGAKRTVFDAGTKISEGISETKSAIGTKITREIPIKQIEKDLNLTPTQRASVEQTGETAGEYMLRQNIAGQNKAQQANSLQKIADDSYNGLTEKLSPIQTRVKTDSARKMLDTMIDEMTSSKIVQRERGPYIEKLKQMKEFVDYSPSELLAIRRDFDRIVGQDIFKKGGRVTGEEDKIIAGRRRDLSDTLKKIGKDNGIDVSQMDTDLRNAITIRDGVLRRLSQENKNNTFSLQDIGVGAVLAAGEPVTATALIISKKGLEKGRPSIMQGLYNLGKGKYEPTDLRRGVTIRPRDTTNGLSIAPDTTIGGANAQGLKGLPLNEGAMTFGTPKAQIGVQGPRTREIRELGSERARTPGTARLEIEKKDVGVKPTTTKGLQKPKTGLKPKETSQLGVKKTNNLTKTSPISTIDSTLGVKTKDMDSLIKEAKKYKSADEFVNARVKAYHGTKYNFDEFDNKFLGQTTQAGSAKQAHFFTNKKSIAEGYSSLGDAPDVEKLSREVEELEKRAKRSGERDLYDEKLQKLEELAYSDANNYEGNIIGVDIELGKNKTLDMKGRAYNESELNDIISKAKKEGYDSVTLKNSADAINTPIGGGIRGEDELSDVIAVFNAKNIKTESQLRKIREEANKKTNKKQ